MQMKFPDDSAYAAYVAEMREAANMSDTEEAHALADDILCRFLRELGCDDIVDAWKAVPKWYA